MWRGDGGEWRRKNEEHTIVTATAIKQQKSDKWYVGISINNERDDWKQSICTIKNYKHTYTQPTHTSIQSEPVNICACLLSFECRDIVNIPKMPINNILLHFFTHFQWRRQKKRKKKPNIDELLSKLKHERLLVRSEKSTKKKSA